MSKYHMGQSLRNFVTEKNLSVARLSTLSGRTRQQVHNDFHRVTIKDDVLDVYAKVLNIEKEEFRKQSLESGKEDSSYLMEQIAKIEAQFLVMAEQSKALAEQLQSQLAVKDRQIDKLMELLGKLSPASGESKEIQHPALLVKAA